VVCVGFLVRAVGPQIYFEPTQEAITGAYLHGPELKGALVAVGAALLGIVVQALLWSGWRTRALCVGGTAALAAAALIWGAAETRARTPSLATVVATVAAVPGPADGIPLPLERFEAASTSDYPSAVRKWQLGDSFLRADQRSEQEAMRRACAAVRAVATPQEGWKLRFSAASYCDFTSVRHHVSLDYSALLVPGEPAEHQRETVVIYVRGETYAR
jgi:hypothetical protein